MIKVFSILIGAVLISLLAPAIAEQPSNAVEANRLSGAQFFSRDIINPMDPGYIWGNPLAIDLSGLNPVIFDSPAFRKDPGGMASAGLYTASINAFRSGNADAGRSNVTTKKAARVGLISQM